MYTLKDIEYLLNKEDYQLIDGSLYSNLRNKIYIKCSNNHYYWVQAFKFKNGERCKECKEENEWDDTASVKPKKTENITVNVTNRRKLLDDLKKYKKQKKRR